MKSMPQIPGSAGASPSVSSASRDTIRTVCKAHRHSEGHRVFGGAPKTAGEAPALPIKIRLTNYNESL